MDHVFDRELSVPTRNAAVSAVLSLRAMHRMVFAVAVVDASDVSAVYVLVEKPTNSASYADRARHNSPVCECVLGTGDVAML